MERDGTDNLKLSQPTWSRRGMSVKGALGLERLTVEDPTKDLFVEKHRREQAVRSPAYG